MIFKKKESLKPKQADLLLNLNKKTSFTESIKSIRTNLAFSEVDKKMQVILITSAQLGDGKSFISANLALAYKDEDKKVLLIDADLRCGRQNQIFRVVNSANKGYSNLILNYQEASASKSKKSVDKAVDFDIKDYIVKTRQGIDLIPNGPTPPNPIELLASNNNEKLIAQLKKMYDIIIIDCTPVLGISDAIVMTKYSDANILVVSNKRTKLELVSRVEKIFSQSHASLTGVVINKVDVSEGGYYGYYSNSYYGESE